MKHRPLGQHHSTRMAPSSWNRLNRQNNRTIILNVPIIIRGDIHRYGVIVRLKCLFVGRFALQKVQRSGKFDVDRESLGHIAADTPQRHRRVCAIPVPRSCQEAARQVVIGVRFYAVEARAISKERPP